MERRPFDLSGRVAVITGGAGLLGLEHAAAIASAGGTPVLLDVRSADEEAARLEEEYGVPAAGVRANVTAEGDVSRVLAEVLDRYGRVDILVNNAANNPPVAGSDQLKWSRLERFPLEQWHADLEVGLTGTLLCSRVFGGELARRGGGVILNIASDLAVIAPDQRLYRQPDRPAAEQPVKPVSYSVVKAGLVGLTRYLATYWADEGVRVNALSPGGVYTGQPERFVRALAERIPLGRMASSDEYRGAVVFLCSDASSYMTGQNVVVDGGRTVW
jgi:NAD(P)-dependent dehydrogenase (short-subunit alcohol dehydrogenase family)